MFVIDGVGRIWKKAIMVYFNALPRILLMSKEINGDHSSNRRSPNREYNSQPLE
jgi:hypothetical protein